MLLLLRALCYGVLNSRDQFEGFEFSALSTQAVHQENENSMDCMIDVDGLCRCGVVVVGSSFL